MESVTKETFDAEVLQSDAVVVADFWAPWCVPCKMMEPVLEKIAGNHGEKIRIVKINVDEEPDLAARYNIVSIPSLLVFDRGEKVDMQVGAVSEAVLDEFLQKYL